MTDAERAAIAPPDNVLLWATVVDGVAGFDAGTHLRVRVKGGATFWAPVAAIVAIAARNKEAAHGLPLS